MAGEEKIRLFIRELAGRKQNVTLEDIEWVMNQLKSHEQVSEKGNVHQRLYSINGRRFGVCTHKSGSKQLKACYVKEFLEAMTDAGWFEE